MTDELLELQRFAELGRYSACLLHEISNPLTAALLHLELSQQRSRSVRRARHSIKLLQNYVEAARQQVRQASDRRPFLVQPQITQLRTVLVPLARQSGVKLSFRDLPQCHLYGDPVKFQQIISNLISNAINASPEGSGIWLTGQLRDGYLILKVRDQAGGMDSQALVHAFDRFTTSRPGRGLGLGLNIVKIYAEEEFGGSINVDNTPSVGMVFTISLPLSKI